MTLRTFNTLTNKKEEFKPLEKGNVRMYVCGQTVYDNMHIGHGRTYIAFDIIRRYLEYKGYTVETVINITDVNDKINKRAKKEKRTPEEVSEEYTRINLEDFEKLGITAEEFPKASDYIKEMIDLVEKLIEKGYAYESKGNVFFDVKKFGGYGKLSNQDLEDLKSDRDDIKEMGAKKDSRDFVLWRSRKDSEFKTYESPWGEGVPGWHIECSAMSSELLGEQFDIHGGGVDLVFPHHEDEIAQSEASTGKAPWVKYWMHAGLVRLKDEKMSKSLGNFVSTRELLEEYRPEVLRILVASTHYRKPLDFSEERIEQAEENFKAFKNAYNNLKSEIKAQEILPEKPDKKDRMFRETVAKKEKKFEEVMDDDFNTPEALKTILELAKQINKYINNDNPKLTVLKEAERKFKKISSVIGVLPEGEKVSDRTEKLVENILELRKDARNRKNYELADKIRESLERSGVEIQDTDEGVRWS